MEDKIYPKWKIEYNEQWDDVHNCYNSLGYTIFVKPKNDIDWIPLYGTSDYNKYMCMVVYNRLKNQLYDPLLKPYILENKLPAMCEINDQVYKVEDIVLDQSCIMLSQIPGNINYGKYETDLIKEEYFTNFIFLYDQDEILIHNKQVFMNGKLLYNHKQLQKLCNQLQQPLDLLAYFNKSLVDYLFYKYPNAKSYICEGDYIHNLDRKE